MKGHWETLTLAEELWVLDGCCERRSSVSLGGGTSLSQPITEKLIFVESFKWWWSEWKEVSILKTLPATTKPQTYNWTEWDLISFAQFFNNSNYSTTWLHNWTKMQIFVELRILEAILEISLSEKIILRYSKFHD